MPVYSSIVDVCNWFTRFHLSEGDYRTKIAACESCHCEFAISFAILIYVGEHVSEFLKRTTELNVDRNTVVASVFTMRSDIQIFSPSVLVLNRQNSKYYKSNVQQLLRIGRSKMIKVRLAQ